MKFEGQWSLKTKRHQQGDLGSDQSPGGYTAPELSKDMSKMPAVETSFKQFKDAPKKNGGVKNDKKIDRVAYDMREKC